MKNIYYNYVRMICLGVLMALMATVSCCQMRTTDLIMAAFLAGFCLGIFISGIFNK